MRGSVCRSCAAVRYPHGAAASAARKREAPGERSPPTLMEKSIEMIGLGLKPFGAKSLRLRRLEKRRNADAIHSS